MIENLKCKMNDNLEVPMKIYGRFNHSMVKYYNEIIIFGGEDEYNSRHH